MPPRFTLLCATLVSSSLACGDAAPAPAAEKDDPAPSEKAPKREAPEPKAPKPELSKDPIPCGDKACTPPEACITVIGSLEGQPARQECWVPCQGEGDEKTCPEGMHCTMIHDGPGEVCSKDEA